VTEKIHMDDRDIISLYFARDEKAITETDRKYKSLLLGVSGRILSSALDCEECLNDTYLKVWNAIPPTVPSDLRAFLVTVIRNLSIDRYYSNKRRSTVPSDFTESLSELGDVVSDGETVADEYNLKELSDLLTDYIRSLSERRRFIFIERYYFAVKIDEIARTLSVSRSTVNKEISEIKRTLKEKLEKEGFTV